ncbi:putative sensor histidine kinase [Rhodovulum sp. PH10]|uniref:hybrid sensor histidine kinase/response regulator n=1 Tax=Rhodovulum sp. PH10 TaxID=1187851 RepID=UPI00027C25C1|nr:ATP-binding protein [Rhodovulum sp. PH10]EJW13390.1 putative sensor histidine kinase [Rhodovulum sp. PH10]
MTAPAPPERGSTAARAHARDAVPLVIATALLVVAIVGPAFFYAWELSTGKARIEAIETDIKRYDLARSLHRDFSEVLSGLAALSIGVEPAERDRVIATAQAKMARATALGAPLDQLLSASAAFVPPERQIALWEAMTTIRDSYEHVAEWRRDGSTEVERTFHFLQIHDGIRTAEAVLGEIDRGFAKRIAASLAESRATLLTAERVLVALALATALIAAAIATFVAVSLRRIRRANRDLAAGEAELSDQNRRFRDALESMGQGLAMFDADGRLIVCNARYVDLYGLRPLDPKPGTTLQEIVGYRIAAGIVERQVDERSHAVPEVDDHWVIPLADGRFIAVFRRMRATGGWVATHTDITDIKRAQDERARAEAEAARSREQEIAAKEACATKTAFFATMSHEIRTPLNGLLGLAATLLETPLDADQRKILEAIDQSGESLLAIVDDILDLSKLDAGRMLFEEVVFSPRALVAEVERVLATQVRAKGLSFRTEVSAAVPGHLLGDPARLRQVLLNLAGNAVKFTARGGRVAIRMDGTVEGDRASLVCAVSDSGIGIAPERLATLFSDYVQADSSINRRFGGTGLGLAISKRIVEQMAGTIAVASTPGAGSTFTVSLTLPVAAAPPAEEKRAPVSYASFRAKLMRLGRPLKVLLAEDNATNQLVVTRMLKEFDVAVRIAPDGRQAVAAVAEQAFDIVLMDVRMPGMDGLEATRWIRARGGAFARLPIVALTANAFPDDVRACREAGMTGFMAKPVRKVTLLETLAEVTRGLLAEAADEAYPGDPQADHSVAPPEPRSDTAGAGLPGAGLPGASLPGSSLPGPDTPVLDLDDAAELREAIGDDGFDETLACFLADSAARLRLLRDLVGQADRAAMKAEAHTLKGAARALGFRRLADIAFALERDADLIATEVATTLVDRMDGAFLEARAAAARPEARRSSADAA